MEDAVSIELTGSLLKFLWGWVREFVGVAAPSNLVGSVIVKIFYCGESEDVEQVSRILKQIFHVCDCLSLLFNILHYYNCLSLCLILFYVLALILTKKVIEHLNSYLREITRRSSGPFTGMRIHFLVVSLLCC